MVTACGPPIEGKPMVVAPGANYDPSSTLPPTRRSCTSCARPRRVGGKSEGTYARPLSGAGHVQSDLVQLRAVRPAADAKPLPSSPETRPRDPARERGAGQETGTRGRARTREEESQAPETRGAICPATARRDRRATRARAQRRRTTARWKQAVARRPLHRSRPARGRRCGEGLIRSPRRRHCQKATSTTHAPLPGRPSGHGVAAAGESSGRAARQA